MTKAKHHKSQKGYIYLISEYDYWWYNNENTAKRILYGINNTVYTLHYRVEVVFSCLWLGRWIVKYYNYVLGMSSIYYAAERRILLRYCVNCGKSTDEGEKFCKYCGTEKRETIQQTNTNQMGTNSSDNNFSPSKKKKRTFLIFLLWVLFFPIMVIVTIAKSEKIKTPTKIILIFIIVVICLAIIAPSDNKYVEKSISESETIIYFEEIADKELRDDFIAACSQIGMDLDKVNNLCQVDDWVGGLRYSFAYENMAMRIYCNMDSTVNTVKLGADTDLYKQGYESYQIDDYIVDDSAETNLIMISEDVVKLQLNYPSTAKFSIFGWSFGRNRKLYFVTNQVTAQNSFGV